jgi:hypothetical protein
VHQIEKKNLIMHQHANEVGFLKFVSQDKNGRRHSFSWLSFLEILAIKI